MSSPPRSVLFEWSNGRYPCGLLWGRGLVGEWGRGRGWKWGYDDRRKVGCDRDRDEYNVWPGGDMKAGTAGGGNGSAVAGRGGGTDGGVSTCVQRRGRHGQRRRWRGLGLPTAARSAARRRPRPDGGRQRTRQAAKRRASRIIRDGWGGQANPRGAGRAFMAELVRLGARAHWHRASGVAVVGLAGHAPGWPWGHWSPTAVGSDCRGGRGGPTHVWMASGATPLRPRRLQPLHTPPRRRAAGGRTSSGTSKPPHSAHRPPLHTTH